MLELLNEYERLEKIMDEIDKAWDEDPMNEEIEKQWDACDEEIQSYVLMGRETGEHIDYDAVEDMCVSNAERDVEQIKYKYWKMGLPEELAWE